MSAGWAAAWLAQVSEDARICRQEQLSVLAEEMGGGRSQGISVAKGFVSDPMAPVDGRLDRESIRAARLARSSAAVEDCEHVLDGMAAAGLCVEAYIVGLRDIDGLSWDRIASAMGISKATAKRRRQVAIDWLDHVGPTRARQGLGTATEAAS